MPRLILKLISHIIILGEYIIWGFMKNINTKLEIKIGNVILEKKNVKFEK